MRLRRSAALRRGCAHYEACWKQVHWPCFQRVRWLAGAPTGRLGSGSTPTAARQGTARIGRPRRTHLGDHPTPGRRGRCRSAGASPRRSSPGGAAGGTPPARSGTRRRRALAPHVRRRQSVPLIAGSPHASGGRRSHPDPRRRCRVLMRRCRPPPEEFRSPAAHVVHADVQRRRTDVQRDGPGSAG